MACERGKLTGEIGFRDFETHGGFSAGLENFYEDEGSFGFIKYEDKLVEFQLSFAKDGGRPKIIDKGLTRKCLTLEAKWENERKRHKETANRLMALEKKYVAKDLENKENIRRNEELKEELSEKVDKMATDKQTIDNLLTKNSSLVVEVENISVQKSQMLKTNNRLRKQLDDQSAKMADLDELKKMRDNIIARIVLANDGQPSIASLQNMSHQEILTQFIKSQEQDSKQGLVLNRIRNDAQQLKYDDEETLDLKHEVKETQIITAGLNIIKEHERAERNN